MGVTDDCRQILFSHPVLLVTSHDDCPELEFRGVVHEGYDILMHESSHNHIPSFLHVLVFECLVERSRTAQCSGFRYVLVLEPQAWNHVGGVLDHHFGASVLHAVKVSVLHFKTDVRIVLQGREETLCSHLVTIGGKCYFRCPPVAPDGSSFRFRVEDIYRYRNPCSVVCIRIRLFIFLQVGCIIGPLHKVLYTSGIQSVCEELAVISVSCVYHECIAGSGLQIVSYHTGETVLVQHLEREVVN